MSCCDCNETPPTIVSATQANGCTTLIIDGTPYTWCEGDQVAVTQTNGCTTLSVNGTPYTWCEGSKVTCATQPNGSIIFVIDGVPCVIPAPLPVPTISVVDNGDCTGTITVNGTATKFIIEEKDPYQHPPASVSSSDGTISIATAGQLFDLTLSEVQVASELAGNPVSVGILCTALTPCIQALIPAPVVDINVQGFVYNPTTTLLTLTETDGTTHQVNLASLVNPAQIIVSADANNLVTLGSDGGAQLTAVQAVNGIQANPAAHCDLVNGLVDPLVTTLGDQGAQTAQIDLAPAATENHGLIVDATGACSMIVPYASTTRHGVVERAAFGFPESTQDHNLFTGNFLTTTANMGDKFRLDDVRYMTARTNQDWFENNFWIQTSRTLAVGTARFPTLESIYVYLSDYRISERATVTITIPAGTTTLGAALLPHVDWHRIQIFGANAPTLPVASDIIRTGFTAAAITADYNANIAAFAPLWTSTLDLNGFTLIGQNGKAFGNFNNLHIRGHHIYINVGRVVFTRCLINTPGGANGLLLQYNASATLTSCLNLGDGANTYNIYVLYNSTIFADKLLVQGALLNNIRLVSGSSMFAQGAPPPAGTAASVVAGARGNNVFCSTNSSIIFTYGVAAAQAAQSNFRADNFSTIGFRSAGPVSASFAGISNYSATHTGYVGVDAGEVTGITYTASDAPTGFTCSNKSAIDFGWCFLPGSSFNNHPTQAILCDRDSYVGVGVATFAASGAGVISRDGSTVKGFGSALPTPSPAIGVVGNNNSIIIA